MNRDILHVLAEARPAHLDPAAPTAAETRQAELAHAMATPPETVPAVRGGLEPLALAVHPDGDPDLSRAPTEGPSRTPGETAPGRGRLRAVRPVWAAAGIAGVAAAAVVAAVAIPGNEPRSTTAIGTATAPAARLTPAQIFLAAAESSARTPAGSGAYWATVRDSGMFFQVGTVRKYLVKDLQRNWTSTARSPKATSWYVSKGYGAHPVTAADLAAWRADGSPSQWTVPISTGGKVGAEPGKDTKSIVIGTAARPSFGNPSNVGPLVFDLVGRNVTVKEVMGLPGTEAALRARLLTGYHGHDTESDRPMARDPWLFRVTAGVLSDMPVNPATRAAAYQILAHIKGTRSLGRVTDPLGRTGQGVAFEESAATGLERQIIVDTTTGLLLSDQEAVVDHSPGYPWAKPGTVVYYTATVRAGWTDAAPVKPERTS